MRPCRATGCWLLLSEEVGFRLAVSIRVTLLLLKKLRCGLQRYYIHASLSSQGSKKEAAERGM